MDLILSTLLSYLVGLAANLRSKELIDFNERLSQGGLANDKALRGALNAARSLDAELRAACMAVAREHHRQGVTPQERPL